MIEAPDSCVLIPSTQLLKCDWLDYINFGSLLARSEYYLCHATSLHYSYNCTLRNIKQFAVLFADSIKI
jgi:hypothetical protein